MTLDEVADFISQDLPRCQRDENRAWLDKVHDVLTIGGMWGSPAMAMVFTKTAEGFDLVLDESQVLVEQ